ncbi:MAG: family 43 glycosylhydrolase [Planctomycetota bacterium]|nr:family 43 glycosylhydrolase [Planctomycetota bacterium]
MKHSLLYALAIFLLAPAAVRAQTETAIPPELATPNYRISDITGIGYDEQWERCDSSNIIKVGDIYHVWYTRFKARTELYAGTVYHATSTDGRNWNERKQAIGPGPAGTWDNFGVITPYMFVENGKYYLYYTASQELPGEPWNIRGKNNRRHIGLAIADSPDGPWKKLPKPILSPGKKGEWDDYLVDDTNVILRDGKYWLYFKGYNWPTTWKHTRWGLAVADKPTGPFAKYKSNPILDSGHCVCVWPHGPGIAALVDDAGPQKFTVQYTSDGINFRQVCKLKHVDIGCAPYDPDAFANTTNGRGITWGVTSRRKNGLIYILRFDVDLEQPQSRRTNLPKTKSRPK